MVIETPTENSNNTDLVDQISKISEHYVRTCHLSQVTKADLKLVHVEL